MYQLPYFSVKHAETITPTLAGRRSNVSYSSVLVILYYIART